MPGPGRHAAGASSRLANVEKRYLIHVAGFNLGLLLRALFGSGTLKGWADAPAALLFVRIGNLNLLIVVFWLPDKADTPAFALLAFSRQSN